MAAVILLPVTFNRWQRAEPETLPDFLKSRGLRDIRASKWKTGTEVFTVSAGGCAGRTYSHRFFAHG